VYVMHYASALPHRGKEHCCMIAYRPVAPTGQRASTQMDHKVYVMHCHIFLAPSGQRVGSSSPECNGGIIAQ